MITYLVMISSKSKENLFQADYLRLFSLLWRTKPQLVFSLCPALMRIHPPSYHYPIIVCFVAPTKWLRLQMKWCQASSILKKKEKKKKSTCVCDAASHGPGPQQWIGPDLKTVKIELLMRGKWKSLSYAPH